MSLAIHTEHPTPGRATLRLRGRLDATTFGDFDDTAQALLPGIAEGGTLVLDLAALDYISSAGLRSFAKARKAMRERGGHTLVLDPQPQVRKVFDIVKAVPIKEIFASVRELDAYLDTIQRQVMQSSED
jgi:sigma-B regulation protein RsbU (phosphoserine phosphatase)